jgi:hypothetical protein
MEYKEYKQVPVAQKPPLDDKLQSRLGTQLKRLFAETALAPIPERFAILLDQLERVGVEGLCPTKKVHVDHGVNAANEALQ